MAENDIGKVSFGIEAAFDPKGLKDAESGLGRLTQAAIPAQRGLGKFADAASVAGGVLIADLAKGLLEATVKVAKFAFTVTESSSAMVESFEHVAHATGLSIRQLQELEPVMRKEGVTAEQMGAMFRVLARNIHEARDPTSQAGQAFDQLGIALTGLESPADVLTLIADRVSRMPDGFEKARLTTELLGRSGTNLIPVLNQGAEGFAKSAQAARAMANVLSEDANKALLEVNDSFDMLDVAQDNLSKHLGVLFAPFVQAVNEARLAAVRLATTLTDDLTIATRTLAVRLEALFGFLRAQAQLSLSEIGKVPEIFERWNHWAAEQIKAIRSQSIAVTDLGTTIGKVDATSQAAARAQQQSWLKSSMALMQVDMGVKIVDESIKAYGRSQEAIGRYIVTQLIGAYRELREASALWAKSDLDATTRAIGQYTAMQAQIRATAAAANQAALSGGTLSPVEFERRSGALAMDAINQEIDAQQQRLAALNTFYAQKLALAEGDAQQQRELIQQQLADTATVNNSLALLEQQRVTQSIANETAVVQATQRATQETLAAKTATAQAEVAILQATFASTEQIRAAQLAAINASEQQQLAIVGLTEEQKLAIYRQAEAQRMGIARQFPTFWEKQLQDLQASNVFSVGQLVSTWSNGFASTIVNAQNFGQAMVNLGKQTATALLQSVIQLGIQSVAQWLLQATQKQAIETTSSAQSIAMHTQLESAKTAVTATQETARTALMMASNKAMIAGITTTIAAIGIVANASMGVMAVALEGVVAFMLAVASSVSWVPIVGQALAGGIIAGATLAQVTGLTAIAAALAATNAALGSASALASASLIKPFASGGIATGPTLGMIGEAGSAEAVIPLNSQGAGFMADMLGLGASRGQAGPTTIIIEWDGKTMMRYVSDNLPSVLRLKGLPA